MFFYVNIFISTEDGVVEKLLIFKIKFDVVYNVLIVFVIMVSIRKVLLILQ